MPRKNPTTFFLVRHGETAWTAERRYQGCSDTSLSPFGKLQARELSKRVKKMKIAKVYTSGLTRAKQTGQAIARMLGQNPVIDSRLNEFGFGKWEGKTAKELFQAKSPAFLKWCSGQWVNPPNGEKLTAFKRRVRGFLLSVLKKHKGKSILVVSHGGPIKMLVFEALKLPFRSFWNLRIDTASISVITCYPGFTQLTALNDIAHLNKLNSEHRKS